MKQVLISVIGAALAANPRGHRWNGIIRQEQEFDEQAEVYRIHFYPRSSSEDQYVLFKRVTSELTQQVNVQEIPDPKYYMTRVAHDLARWQGYTSQGAQNRFINSDFELDYSTVWRYGCYGQLRPYRHGKGEPVDVFDKIYKDYQTCLACVKHDFGEKMVPKYSFCYDLREFRFLCPTDLERNSESQWAQCECDAKLANNLAKVRSQNSDFMLNNQVVFDEQCREGKSGGGGQDTPAQDIDRSRSMQAQCCGEYPSRFIFHTNGNRQCCGNKLYNSDSQKCCSDSIFGLEKSC